MADEPIYLDVAGEPVHLVVHRPSADSRGTGVILCPPFGFDEVCSYRPRREWARRLAAAGYPALRLSYPGTGDSAGSPRDPGLLDTWRASVAGAATWLLDQGGVDRVTAIGIGIGGLLAYLAAAQDAAITDLVFWGTPARGRTLIRQLRAFSSLELDRCFEGLELPAALPDGELQAGGFLLSAEFVASLEALDLTALTLPVPCSRRALLLERDGLAVDAALRKHLETQSVSITVAPGEGYAAMTSHPQGALAPNSVIDQVAAWLEQAPAAVPIGRQIHDPPRSSKTATVGVESTSVHESPITINQPFGRLSGILTEPTGSDGPQVCGVLLNAGAVRCCGPNRIWTELARRWAGRGVRMFRLDVEGIGDADGEVAPYVEDDPLYADKLIDQVIACLDELQARGIADQFVLIGICAGAYWSLHGALRDERVSAAMCVNLRAVVWDPALSPARDFRALIAHPLSLAKIREQASAPRVRALARWLIATPKRWLVSRWRRRTTSELSADQVLEHLGQSGKDSLFLFTEHEPLRDNLARSGALERLQQQPNVTLDYVSVRDHTFRPIQSQVQVHAILDRALERSVETGTGREVRA